MGSEIMSLRAHRLAERREKEKLREALKNANDNYDRVRHKLTRTARERNEAVNRAKQLEGAEEKARRQKTRADRLADELERTRRELFEAKKEIEYKEKEIELLRSGPERQSDAIDVDLVDVEHEAEDEADPLDEVPPDAIELYEVMGDEWQSRDDLVDALGVSDRTVRRRLDSLLDVGVVEETTADRGRKVYRRS